MKTVFTLIICITFYYLTPGQINMPKYFTAQNENEENVESAIVQAANGDLLMFWFDRYDTRIFYSRSTDGGNNWLQKQIAAENVQIDNLSRIDLNAVVLNNGRILLSYKGHIVVLPYAYHEVYLMKYSDNNGGTWSEPLLLPIAYFPFDYQKYFKSSLGLTSDGRAAFIHSPWSEQTSEARGIKVIFSPNGISWSGNTLVDAEGTNGSLVSLGNSKDMIVFEDMMGGTKKIFQRTSTDNGITWSEREVLLSDSSDLYRPRATGNNFSEVRVYFQKDDETIFSGIYQPEIYFIKSTDLGTSWSLPQKFTNYAGLDSLNNVSFFNDQSIVTFSSSRYYDINRQTMQIYYGGQPDSSAPPYLLLYDHSPDTISTHEPINFIAFVDDDEGMESVFLVTSINVFNIDTLLMYDDGLHNDSLPGDNIYGVTLQKGINNGDNLRYDFLLKDVDGNYAGFNGSDIYLPLNFAVNSYLIEANKLKMPLNNEGVLADVYINGTSSCGFDESTIIFAAGFYLSGKNDDEIWANRVSFSQDYQPGIVGSNPNDPKNSLYIIKASDPPFGESWQNYIYAVQLGADFYDGDNDGIYDPVDLNGNHVWDLNEDRPDMLGDVTIWCVYNDGVPYDRRGLYNVHPLGIEIKQTVFALGQNLLGPIQNMMFIRYRITNKGTVSSELDSTYFSVWADPDIGIQYADDLVGSDTLLNTGYAYSLGEDPAYGSNPPSVGMPILQGAVVYIPGETFIDNNGNGEFEDSIDTPLDTAIVNNGLFIGSRVYPGAKNLPITSFIHYISSHPTFGGPRNALQARNYMLGGRLPSGEPIDPCSWTYGEVYGIPCNEINPLFIYSGDPVTELGWINTLPTDQRTMVNTGPFTLEANKPVDIWAAYVVGRGNDGLNSITKMRENIDYAHRFYNSNFSLLPTGIAEPGIIPEEYVLYQNYPNPFNPITRIKFQIPQAGKVTIKIYDILGAEVTTLLNEVRSAGIYEIDFNASRLASGVYFYQLKAGSFIETKKMILLK